MNEIQELAEIYHSKNWKALPAIQRVEIMAKLFLVPESEGDSLELLGLSDTGDLVDFTEELCKSCLEMSEE